VKKTDLISFANADELAQAVAGKWLDEIAAANRAGKRHCVALSGGRIARKFFASVVEQAKARKIGDGDTPSLPGNVHFFWADERCVPPDDVESNFKLANELLFLPLKISENQIHRIHGELPPDKAAELATAEIRCVTLSSPSPPQKEERAGSSRRSWAKAKVRRPIVSNSNPLAPTLSPLGRGEGVDFQPILDLIFLGMGEDGHVASLFPGESEMAAANQAVYRAIKKSPKPPPNRVTLGYAAMAAARQVWVLVSGTGKKAVLHESLFCKNRTPLARVTQFRTQTKNFSYFFMI
jgi:6-phosphogluconolactonase